MGLIQLVILFVLSAYASTCSRVTPGSANGSGFTATVPDGAGTAVGSDGIGGVGGTTGANGGDGRNGINGQDGEHGEIGLACWDLNENGIGDVDTEDINDDGTVNIYDCQGRICSTPTEQNCYPCAIDRDTNGCLVISNQPSCDIFTDDICREINACQETVIPPNCSGCPEITIPPLATNCGNSEVALPDSNRKKINVSLTACMSGFHVLRVTLGTLSWQTLTGKIYASNHIGKEEDNIVETYDDDFYDIGLAPHCYDTYEDDDYDWLEEESGIPGHLYNRIMYSVEVEDEDEDEDEDAIKIREDDTGSYWSSPAYNYLDFSTLLNNQDIDYSEPYIVYDLEITGKDEDGDEYKNFVYFLDADLSTGSKQVKYYVNTILWDSWDDFDFGPIMTIKFSISYYEKK